MFRATTQAITALPQSAKQWTMDSMQSTPFQSSGVRCMGLFVGTDVAPEVCPRDWSQRVLQNPLPVMVHLWSDSLVPERSAAPAPIIDDVVLEFAGKIDACTMAYDRSPDAMEFATSFLPVVHFYKDGKLVHTVVPALKPVVGYKAVHKELHDVAARLVVS